MLSYVLIVLKQNPREGEGKKNRGGKKMGKNEWVRNRESHRKKIKINVLSGPIEEIKKFVRKKIISQKRGGKRRMKDITPLCC